MGAMMASITSELLFFLPFILLALLTFYTTTVAKCHGGGHRWWQTKRKRPNLPPGAPGWPLVGETFAYLRAHPATSVGRFMEQHVARSVKLSVEPVRGADGGVGGPGAEPLHPAERGAAVRVQLPEQHRRHPRQVVHAGARRRQAPRDASHLAQFPQLRSPARRAPSGGGAAHAAGPRLMACCLRW